MRGIKGCSMWLPLKDLLLKIPSFQVLRELGYIKWLSPILVDLGSTSSKALANHSPYVFHYLFDGENLLRSYLKPIMLNNSSDVNHANLWRNSWYNWPELSAKASLGWNLDPLLMSKQEHQHVNTARIVMEGYSISQWSRAVETSINSISFQRSKREIKNLTIFW